MLGTVPATCLHNSVRAGRLPRPMSPLCERVHTVAMAVLIALLASLAYGVGDFCGGLASRRSHALPVLLLGGPVGTALMLVAALAVGGDVLPAAGTGLLAGIAGAAGIIVFYRALTVGTMSVIAPVTALTSAAVPLGVGVLVLGERPGLLAGIGIAVALLAVVLVGLEPRRPDAPAGRRAIGSGVGMALLAGAGFGLFFVALNAAPDGTGLWPVVWARVATVSVAVGVALRMQKLWLPRGRTALIALASGVLDGLANIGVLLAVRAGDLSTASVVISLYPAATVLLARLVLGERLARVQQAGLGVAVLGVVLISV